MAKYNYRQLICHLEYIVAKHCCNSNNLSRYFRYPVHYKKNGEWYYTKGKYLNNAPRESLLSLHYVFGSNKLDIGKALSDIVRFIADDIDSDTDSLENEIVGSSFGGKETMYYNEMICRMEYYVAKRCYNNSYSNGYYYRYPVKYYSEGTRYRTKDGIANVPTGSLGTMYYDFGANRLYIGEALCEIIRFIIDEYDCCFELLEEQNDDEIKQIRIDELKQIFWDSSPSERIELLKRKEYADLFPEYVKLFKEGNPNERYD
ncbi:MAG: hypothetical protein J5501_01050 [Ruminococcus sp.]|nr:hypothetical protein [Ruminococcus sp.]